MVLVEEGEAMDNKDKVTIQLLNGIICVCVILKVFPLLRKTAIVALFLLGNMTKIIQTTKTERNIGMGIPLINTKITTQTMNGTIPATITNEDKMGG